MVPEFHKLALLQKTVLLLCRIHFKTTVQSCTSVCTWRTDVPGVSNSELKPKTVAQTDFLDSVIKITGITVLLLQACVYVL